MMIMVSKLFLTSQENPRFVYSDLHDPSFTQPTHDELLIDLLLNQIIEFHSDRQSHRNKIEFPNLIRASGISRPAFYLSFPVVR